MLSWLNTHFCTKNLISYLIFTAPTDFFEFIQKSGRLKKIDQKYVCSQLLASKTIHPKANNPLKLNFVSERNYSIFQKHYNETELKSRAEYCHFLLNLCQVIKIMVYKNSILKSFINITKSHVVVFHKFTYKWFSIELK